MIAPVTTAQIYWGAIPFVVIQLIMVGVLIAFPDLVLSSLDRGPKVDPSQDPDRGAAEPSERTAAIRVQVT